MIIFNTNLHKDNRCLSNHILCQLLQKVYLGHQDQFVAMIWSSYQGRGPFLATSRYLNVTNE